MRGNPRGADQNQSRNWLPKVWEWETRVWVAFILLLIFGVLLLFAARVVFVFFAAILLALFLSGLAEWVRSHTKLSRKWALAVVILTLTVGMAALAVLVAPSIGEQFTELTTELPKAAQKVEEQLKSSVWGRQLLNSSPDLSGFASKAPEMFGRATGVTFGFLTDAVIFLIVGVYLAVEPETYKRGIVCLFPPERRRRLGEVLSALAAMEQRWIVGQMALMALNAVITATGLWLLGMRLPVTLGLLSGLLNFVPNLGPIIAAVPAVLLALVQGPWMALYVALFFVTYQAVDGYLFTPLVQRRSVALPPAMTIMSQVLLGVLFGAVGVLIAVPLIAAVVVLVKMLYLEDVLGEEVTLPHEHEGKEED